LGGGGNGKGERDWLEMWETVYWVNKIRTHPEVTLLKRKGKRANEGRGRQGHKREGTALLLITGGCRSGGWQFKGEKKRESKVVGRSKKREN